MMSLLNRLVIKDNFGICPMCSGTCEVLVHVPDTHDKKEIIDCTHCFYGVIIKEECYEDIINELGLEHEEL